MHSPSNSFNMLTSCQVSPENIYLSNMCQTYVVTQNSTRLAWSCDTDGLPAHSTAYCTARVQDSAEDTMMTSKLHKDLPRLVLTNAETVATDRQQWHQDAVPDMTYNVFGGTVSLTQSINQVSGCGPVCSHGHR